MKVHLIRKESVEVFALQHANSRTSLQEWLKRIKAANWAAPEDIVESFNAADLLGNGSNRVVFDIGGNNFRMICKYRFGKKNVHLYVKWAGTHSEYNVLCKKKGQYTINAF